MKQRTFNQETVRIRQNLFMATFSRTSLKLCLFSDLFVGNGYPQAPVPTAIDLSGDLVEARRIAAQQTFDPEQLFPRAEHCSQASSVEVRRALPTLINALDDPSPIVRSYTALCFDNAAEATSSSISGDPERLQTLAPALPRLLAHLDDPARPVRGAVQLTYPWFFGTPEAKTIILPALLKQLESPVPLEGQRSADQAGVSVIGDVARLGHDDPHATGAVIAFLQDPGHSQETVSDLLHNIALSNANERVNDAALQIVFQRHAMSIFLLQFVARMKLTAQDLEVERGRLYTLAADSATHPALRRAAKAVADCWTNDAPYTCKPSEEDLRTQSDTATKRFTRGSHE